MGNVASLTDHPWCIIGTDGDGVGDALEGNVISGNTYNIQLTGASVNRSHHPRRRQHIGVFGGLRGGWGVGRAD